MPFVYNIGRGGFRISLRGVRDLAREARAIFFRTPLSNLCTPLRCAQGGAKLIQGGAIVAQKSTIAKVTPQDPFYILAKADPRYTYT